MVQQQRFFVFLLPLKHALDLFDQKTIMLLQVDVLILQRLIHLLAVISAMWSLLWLISLDNQTFVDEGCFRAGSISVF